jgi:uncharacterized protein involved in outer membrane biogenesis
LGNNNPGPDLQPREDGGSVVRRNRKWIWAAYALVFLFIAYLLAGYFLVPGLIRSQAAAWVQTNLDKKLALGEIKFDPLRFTVDIGDIAIPDAQQQPIVAVGHLKIGFSILSLFQHAYRFTDVRIDRPFVRAIVQPNGALNLIELVPKTKSEGPSPAVRIDTFAVDQGRIVYADDSREQRPEKTLTPISFTLKDFQTDQAKGGAFTLKAKSEKSEGFDWTGTLSIAPIASGGRLTVAGLQSDTIQKFLGEMLPVVLTGGQIGFTADYNFAYDANGMRLGASVPTLSLTGLSLDGKKNLFRGSVKLDRLQASVGPVAMTGGKALAVTAAMPRLDLQGLGVIPAGGGDAIKLASLSLKDAKLDMGAHQITLGSLALDGADLPVRREKDGHISLMAMMPEKAGDATQAVPVASAPWNIRLENFALSAASLRIEDRAVTPAARFAITPINFTATGAGSDLTQPVNIRFDARIDRTASLSGEGAVTPEGGVADLKFALAGLKLPAFAAYMPRLPDLELKSGILGASGTLHYQSGDMSALRFQGDASVGNFNVMENASKSPLVSWQSFTLKSIDYRSDRLEIAGGRLSHPLGRLAVLPDRSFSYKQFMPGSAAPAATTTSESAPVAKPAPVKAVPVQAAPAKVAAVKPAPAMKIRMKRLDVDHGTMSFADYSMQPNFEARIDALQGAIINITNQPGQVAAIDFTGQVIDQFSPVTIKGAMDPFAYDRQTALSLAFHNIELPVFNPYSGRYAGYAIAKGKLTTELSYKIDNRALKADHHVVIDQLEWGAATESKEAVPLPIRLATALLKDKNGVIDLSLPVVGSLDDPKFRIWPLVWQIVGNVIEKAIAAPFQLIGSLFAGAEKAQFVDFAPGAADLPAGAPESLGAFAKALVEKPAINLDIPAGPAIAEDATGIADTAIEAQAMAKEIKRGNPAKFASLDRDEQHDRLEDVYRAKLGKRPDYPEFPADALKAGATATPPLDESDQRTVLETQWLRTELRKAFAPTGAQLAALGLARATAVRDALLADRNVNPERVFLATALTVTPTDGHSRLELKLK